MKQSLIIPVAIALALGLSACSEPDAPAEPAAQRPSDVDMDAAPAVEPADDVNPLLVDSGLPYGMPAFDRIEDHHFAPAIEQGMEEHAAEIDAIAMNPEAATFENTIVAMEEAGQTLGGVMRVFSNLAGANTNENLQAVQREMAPKLSAHSDAINLNAALFARIEALYLQRDELDLDAESLRLLEDYHTSFVRAGAQLNDEDKDVLREINTELAQLGTAFSQKVLAEVNDSAVVFDSRDYLQGLSEGRIQAAANAAADRDLEDGQYVVTLLNTSGQPPLSSMENREARERVHLASLNRGSRGGEFDTTETVSRIVELRARRAQLLGYDTHADYILERQTAGSVQTVVDLHNQVGPIAVANARREGEALQALINELEDEPFELASWDWAFYTDKLRERLFDVDDAEVRAYFELESVLKNGVFYSAEKLFGITFVERPDLPVYHPDVRVWEAFEEDGTPLGLMLTDLYARSNKRGGAWMNSYRINSGLLGGHPVTGNHLNITKPPEGEPTLMTWDEVTTLFHEFGHVIHGLFSDVHYPSFAATAVPRDFVEFPSQVYEMWADWPEVLQNYARHYETGEPIPEELLERVMEAAQFNEGFRTTEYLAASIIDMELHRLGPDEVPAAEDIMAFEARVLAESGMDFAPVPPRYRIPYFSHSMGGYSAGYYSYFWSEVLDADAVLWIRENGGLDRETGQHFRDTILSQGGSRPAMELYEDFAGRQPGFEPLLERRGLVVED
ncbi:MAG: M3 family metallopeptidase [Wenzhouxiangella sp.]